MRAHTLLLAGTMTALGLLVVAGSANAQTPTGSQIITIDGAKATADSLAPGQTADVSLVVVRSCSNAAQVLPAGTIEVRALLGEGVLVVTGPSSVAVDQQVCAQENRHVETLAYKVTARSNAEETQDVQAVVDFRVMANGQGVTPTSSNEASAKMLFTVLAPKVEAQAASAAAEAKTSPGAGIEVGLGLLGLVAAARRGKVA